ncbi:cytochrome P450 2U1-like [Styela clava]
MKANAAVSYSTYGVNVETAILFVMVFGLCYYLLKRDKKSNNLPPGPKGWPLLGNLPALSFHSEEEMLKWNKEYGPVCRLKMVNMDFMILGSVEAVQEAFVRKCEIFSDRLQNSISAFSGSHGIIFLNYDRKLKEQRRFALATLREFGMGSRSIEPSILDKCSALCDLVETELEKKQPFALDFMIYQTVSSVITQLVFGKNLADENEDFRQYLQLLMTGSKYSTLSGIATLFPPLRKIPPFSWGPQVAKQREKTLRLLYQEQIDEHRRTRDPKEPRDFIDCFLNKMDVMAESPDEAEAIGFNEDQLLALARDFFLAGSETTSTTICWAVLFLSRNQDIQNKFYNEIMDVIGDAKQPSTAFADEMPYSKAVIQEVLRMRPIAPIAIPHRARQEGTIMGYRIPKGAIVAANIFAIQNNDEVWNNPKMFDPFRHIDADGKFVKSANVIPFSIGARQCLAMQLANMELFLIIVSLFQRYRFEFAGDSDIDMRGRNVFTLRPYPFKVLATKR